MSVITEAEMGEMRWPSRRLAMISARKIDGRTEEKTVVSIAVRIDEKIAVRTDKPIGERIIGPMQAGNSVDLIERIMSPGNMGAMGERMPA
jgi:hypothetical protein